MGNRFGLLGDGWPASAQYVAPFFAIVVDVVGQEEAAAWFEAARRRELEVEQARTHQFGFAVYLSSQLDHYDQEPTPARTSAWEAMKAVREIVRQDSAADLDVFLDCALEACEHSSQPCSEPVAATAGA